MKSKPTFKTVAALAVACSALLGCSHTTANIPITSRELDPEQRMVMTDSTNKYLGEYLGMKAWLYRGVIWPSTNVSETVWMYSATSRELLKIISPDDFTNIFVLKNRPEYR